MELFALGDTAVMPVFGRLYALEQKINDETRGLIEELKIVSDEDGVTLRGHSATYFAKQLAQQLTIEDYPNAEVSNAIEVA